MLFIGRISFYYIYLLFFSSLFFLLNKYKSLCERRVLFFVLSISDATVIDFDIDVSWLVGSFHFIALCKGQMNKK